MAHAASGSGPAAQTDLLDRVGSPGDLGVDLVIGHTGTDADVHVSGGPSCRALLGSPNLTRAWRLDRIESGYAGAGSRSRCGTRPSSGGSSRTACARARRSSLTSACGPSHSAVSGDGCTSTMIPSAPTAIAAFDSGTTRSRRPPACDGSTTTGRCDSPCAIGTAEMSRVLRVAVSNVRIPRSHSTMSRLPRWAMYSAAI